jgi:hypothetical protein
MLTLLYKYYGHGHGEDSPPFIPPDSLFSSSSTQHTYAYTSHRQATEAEYEEHLAVRLLKHRPIVELPRPKLCKEEHHIGRRIAVKIKGAKVLAYTYA